MLMTFLSAISISKHKRRNNLVYVMGTNFTANLTPSELSCYYLKFREAKIELDHHNTFKGMNFPAISYVFCKVAVTLKP
jgi:hypothetical protein